MVGDCRHSLMLERLTHRPGMYNKVTSAAINGATNAMTVRHQIVIALACDIPEDGMVMGTRWTGEGWLRRLRCVD
jgi:hypothetical protein